MKSNDLPKGHLKVLVCEMQNPPSDREVWGTDIAEFRGKFYKLLGEYYLEKAFADFSLLATCVKNEGDVRPSFQITHLSELEP